MTMMTAFEVPAKGAKLNKVERPLPEPGADEVRIAVQACGVCHSDSITVEGNMPGISYPRVPGHEVIGLIDAMGSEVKGFEIGQRVGVGWNAGSCGWCHQCRRGNAYACLTIQDVTGVYRDGGYATHMIARQSALARVPAELDSVESAPLLCAGITTFNAIRNSGARPGDLVAILGIGGLGHLAVQYAARMGFRVVAVNRGTDKEALARDLGAHDYIDSKANDPAAALMAMGGAMAIIATATHPDAMRAISTGLAPGGTMMVIGAVGPFEIDSLDLLMKSAAVRGWYSGIAPDSEDALAFSSLTNVKAMNEIYPLDDAQAAYDRMMSGDARFRVVLKVT
jgi:D-arabinose 1-dehydrogenase-like Zn-dependent alcohol dehydrogenase